MDGLENRVVVITGAGNGIGRSCAERFAREGAACLLCDVNEEGLQITEKNMGVKSGAVRKYVFDIRDSEQISQSVQAMLGEFEQLHVLVNSAGIGYEKFFPDITEEEWKRCIDINLNGIVFTTKYILKNMMEKRYGRIINISSQAGKFGRPLHSHYSASKFGLNGFTEALSHDVAKYGITVNAVCPSRIKTDMIENLLRERMKKTGKTYEEVTRDYVKDIPVGRIGLPEDVASLVAYLASDEAGYITGQCISVSGGR